MDMCIGKISRRLLKICMLLFIPMIVISSDNSSIQQSVGRRSKVELYVFCIAGSDKIGVSSIRWPSSNGTTGVQEIYAVSSDIGKTWQRVNDLWPLIPDPRRLGHHKADSKTEYREGGEVGQTRFLELSNDEGKTWRRAEALIEGTSEVLENPYFMAFHPRDANTFFVSGQVLGNKNIPELNGLYVSHNKGSSFALLGCSNMPIKFDISELKPDVMYCTMFGQYLSRSIDSGRSWKLVGPFQANILSGSDSSIQEENQGVQYIYGVRIDPHNHRTVYAQTSYGIWKSSDDGGHWRLLRPSVQEKVAVSSMVVAADKTETVIMMGTDVGLFISRNAGDDWMLVDLPSQ